MAYKLPVPPPVELVKFLKGSKIAPRVYSLELASEIMGGIYSNHSFSPKDISRMASALGIVVYTEARAVAVGDTLIIPPKPRPKTPHRIDWEDFQRLIDYCDGHPEFIQRAANLKNDDCLSPEPEVIRGKPETLRAWIEWVITEEEGLTLASLMPDGLQARLIERAKSFGYMDNSAVKRAWADMRLKAARNTKK